MCLCVCTCLPGSVERFSASTDTQMYRRNASLSMVEEYYYNKNIIIPGLPSIQQHRATDTNIHNIVVHVVYMVNMGL